MARWRVAPRRLVQSGGRVYSPGDEIEYEPGLESQGAIEPIPVLETVDVDKRERLATMLGKRSELMGKLAMLDDASRDAILAELAERLRARHDPAPEDASVGESEDEPAAKAPAKKKSPTKKAE